MPFTLGTDAHDKKEMINDYDLMMPASLFLCVNCQIPQLIFYLQIEVSLGYRELDKLSGPTPGVSLPYGETASSEPSALVGAAWSASDETFSHHFKVSYQQDFW